MRACASALELLADAGNLHEGMPVEHQGVALHLFGVSAALAAAWVSVFPVTDTIDTDIERGLTAKQVVAAAITRGEEPEKAASRLYSEGLKVAPATPGIRTRGYVDTVAIRDALVASGMAPDRAEAIIGRRALRGFCMYIGSKEKNREEIRGTGPRTYVWGYQAKLFEAALVDVSRDSEAAIGAKVSRVWKANEDALTCKSTQFDVTGGSAIKYAVSMKFEELLIDMVNWKVDLNRIDQADGRTLLDYVSDQIASSRGLPSEPHLRSYYQMLQKAGAKHRRELAS